MDIAADERTVERARRFNRFYTGAIGVLADGYLGSGLSLAEGRVIYEIAAREGAAATAIGGELGMDPGYLSRILKRLEGQGLVARVRAESDRRSNHLALTQDGRAAFEALDEAARRSIGNVLKDLGPDGQARLTRAMDQIEGLLAPASAPDLRLRQPLPGDLGWIVERHGVLYQREQGWEAARFEPLVARIVAEIAAKPDPAREHCWIAERGGERLGCVFLCKDSDTTARIRLLLVEPAGRGLGLGKALAQACVDFARAAGYREIVLWTHAELTAARQIYAGLGFHKTESWEHTDFGPRVVSETWKLQLQ